MCASRDSKTLNDEELCTSVAILDKVPLRGGTFEVPTLPTLGIASRRLVKISRLAGI